MTLAHRLRRVAASKSKAVEEEVINSNSMSVVEVVCIAFKVAV